MPQPLVTITTDRAWFHVDVYVREGSAWVKKFSQGPFETTADEADQIVTDTNRKNMGARVNAYVYDPSLRRWQQWR